jgi:hypothetical protein
VVNNRAVELLRLLNASATACEGCVEKMIDLTVGVGGAQIVAGQARTYNCHSAEPFMPITMNYSVSCYTLLKWCRK